MRPLRETDLGNQFWFEPAKFFHLVGCNSFAEMAFAAARQILERTFGGEQRPHRLKQSLPARRIKSLTHLARENQFLRVIITNEDRLETSDIRFVAANYELL